MIYRIKPRMYVTNNNKMYSLTGKGSSGLLLGSYMDELGLRGPRKDDFPSRARFYFTEEGWDQFGRELMRIATKLGMNPKVEKRKNPKKSEIIYKDRWQIVILP